MLLATAGTAGAGVTLTVDTLDDGVATASDCTTPVANSCSLRDALAAANDTDTIVFATGLTGTINLTDDQLLVTKSVSIVGAGVSSLTVNQTLPKRVFYVTSAAGDVSISGLTVTGANTGDTGTGIHANNTGSLTLQGVRVTGNTSTGGGGALRVFSGGTVTITETTVDSNLATGQGWTGGLYLGGSNRTVNVIDSTFSANTSSFGAAGGMGLFGTGNTITIANTTIANNSADAGAGALVYDTNTVAFVMCTISGNTSTHPQSGIGYAGGVLVQNNNTQTTAPVQPSSFVGTILSGNTSTASPTEADLAVYGTSTVTVTDSLVGAASNYVDGGGIVLSTSPGLGPLASNGGPTKTMALLTGSPAIDVGPTTVPTFTGNQYDQRGTGFDRVSGGRADIGAFEVQAPPGPSTTTTSTTSTSTTSTSTTTSTTTSTSTTSTTMAPVVTTTTTATDPVAPTFAG